MTAVPSGVRDGLQATLPPSRGPLSAAVAETLRGDPAARTRRPRPDVRDADPLGDDLQLALHLCYELHYRGFEQVPDGWEWDPGLLGLRAELETAFTGALRDGVAGGDDVLGELEDLLVEPAEGTGVSHVLHGTGTWDQMREYFVHRSVYHLKEADPHAWVIPRLQGHAKAALVAVEFDEFGGGRGDRMHARLYQDLLAGAGLDTGYLAYLDAVPAEPIALVNMMSMFALHRATRGALVGHFAAAEITTPPSARRLVGAMERMGGVDPACLLFFTEHIEADAVHEQLMRRDVIGDLLAREPGLAADVTLGIQATNMLEERFGARLLDAWRQDSTALRHPLPAAGS